MANRAKQDVRFRGKTYRPGQILPKSGIKKDPTQGIRDLPPDFGRMLVPQILTFTGRSNFSSHTYRLPDEAIRHSMENARAMRRDCSIMECLEARQRGSALLNWHLEVPDKQDKRQAELLTQMTEIINAIPRFTEYRRNLLEAIWYGRYAIQQSFSFKAIGGHRRCVVKDWLPINGDKLSFRYDDGTGKFKSGQVGVRVGLMNIGDYFNGRKVEYTELGPAYFLEDWERKRIVCHKHMIEDGEYEDVISAGRIHGVGVRDRIYWCWYQKQEAIANLMEVIQRTGTGFTIYWYPFGNPEAKASVEEMALNQGSSNVLLMPRMSGDPSMDAFGVDRIEPSTSGIETLKNIAHEFFGHQIKRYVLGQTLSTEAQATGLGSGVADLHFESFLGIVEYDAKNLEETLTTELIEPLKNINFQWAHGIPVKFRIDTRSADSEKKLNAVRSAWEIGAKIKAADVMDLIGLSMPEGSDDVLVNPTILQQVRLWKKQGEQELGQAGLSGGPYNELQSLFGPLANEVQSGSIPDVTDESDIELGDDEEQVQEPAPQQFAKSHQQRVAAAVKATHSNPSDAQREAGNYAKGTVYLHGLEIAIETPKGAKRNPSWKPLQAHYGYIRRTKGADREPVDCFIGPHPESQVVFVVDMPDKAGRFDEHKALIGWYTVDEARRALAASYHPGWKIGPVTALTVTQFRNWLEKGRTREPIHKQISRYAKRLPSSAGQRDLFSDSITTGKGSSQTLFDQPKKPASSEWTQEDERKHPRGDDGQWISKDEATGELSLKKQPERVEEKPQPEAAAPATTPATKRWLAKQLWNALGGASTYTAADQKFMLGKVEKFLADKPTTAQDVQDSLVNFAWMKGESVTPEGAKRYNELLELIKDKHFVDELPKKSQPEQHRGNPAEPKAKPEVKAQANLFGDEEKPKPSVDLFGNEIKPKFKPAEFDDLGGKQQALFGTAGMPGQMNLFADTGVPDELVNPAMREKAEKQVAAPDPSGRSQAIANGLKKALDYATINSPSQAERVAADVWPTMTSQEQSHFSGYKEFAGAVGKAYQDQRSEAFDPEQAIKIAADSVSALRKQDVYRVLDSNPPERMAEIAAYIKKNRKELTGDVDEALSDIAEERGVPAATPPKASEVILEKGIREMAIRSVAAYDHLRESIETLGGVDHDTAGKLADHYISKKLAKLDMVNGSSSVKHGGYLDKSFIENKVNELGLGKTPDDAKLAEAQPPQEAKQLAGHAIDVETNDIFADGKKRSGFGPKSIAMASLKGANAIWHHQGDYNQLRFNAAQDGASEATKAKAKAKEIEAAYAAGYRFVNHRAGKYGTLWTLEKDGRTLTERGAKAIVSGSASVDIAGEGMEHRHNFTKAFSSWIDSLPESTTSNLGALVTAFNRSPLAEHATLQRDGRGGLRISGKGEKGQWHLHEATQGHDEQGNWQRNLESSLPRFFDQIKHMASTAMPEGEGGWATHERDAASAAISGKTTTPSPEPQPELAPETTKPQTGDNPQQYKRLDSSAGQMDLFGGPAATGRGSTGMLWTEEQEAKHPRDESGKWAPKNEPQQTVAAEPADGFSDDQIRDAIQGTTKLVASLGKKSGVSDNDLEDFVQDVQLKAWQNRQTYSPSQGHFTTWIGNIARHHAFSSHRKNRAKKRGGDAPTESLDAVSGDGGSTRASQVADHRVPSADSRMSEIMASIQEMEPRAQKWLTQHYVEGKSQTEIATESGVTKQAVNNVLNRAVDKLRAKLRYRKQTIINAIRKMKSK